MFIFSKLLFHVFRIVGLMPIKVTYFPPRGHIATHSKLLRIYNCTLLTFVGLYFLGFIKIAYVHFSTQGGNAFWANLRTPTSIITLFFCSCALFVGTGVCLTTGLCKTNKKKIQLLGKFKEIDFLLLKNNLKEPMRPMSYFNILFIFTLLIVDYVVYLAGFNDDPGQVVSLVIRGMMMCSSVEYMEIVLAIKDRFQLINQRIMQVAARHRTKQLLWTVELPCVETFTMPQELKMSITSLSDIHWSLCSTVCDTNDIYGYQMVAFMVYDFACLVFIPYYVFLIYVYNYSVLYIIMQCMWMMSSVILLYTLVWSCSLTVDEGERTPDIVSRLLNTNIDDQLYKELETFAHQLFHRNIEFSACGLFTLQTPLILSVASTVTTYLAIIIQFQTSDVEIETEPTS